jgi:hypothetical protein
MATRLAFVYDRVQDDFDLGVICAILKPLGLTLEHPTQRTVLALSDEGDQIPINREQLEAQIRRGLDTSFQFWFAADHDLYARIETQGDVRIIEFGLEGTAEAERNALREILVSDFYNRAGLGLVFDPEGVTEEYDWDRFFVRGETLRRQDLADMPELLLIPRPLWAELEGFSGRIEEDVLIIEGSAR